jgi:ribonuclease D
VSSSTESPERLIASSEELAGLVSAVDDERRMGLDTEFMRERTYRARLCLVQVATRRAVALIDPLGGVDLTAIARLIGDAAVEVVVHAGRQDLDIFHSAFGVVPARVLDVQVAAAFAGYGASLPYGRLVERVCDVSLGKGESYTDWCRRPLTAAQLTYAADDVRWLLPLADRLSRQLDRLGRAQWVAEELDALARPESYGADPERAWRRVAGRGALSGRQTAVLKEVAAWRERAAAERDLPRGWLVKDPTLVEIARRQPSTVPALRSIRGVNARMAERSGPSILAAVAAGRAADPIEQDGARGPKGVLARARTMAGLADAVVRARCERAGIATEMVTTRGETEALLVDVYCGRLDPARHRLLQGWRAELAGWPVVSVARGETAVRATNDPPYLEEVPV